MRKIILLLTVLLVILVVLIAIFGKTTIKWNSNTTKVSFSNSPFCKNHFDSGRLLIVTFWATWCEGCIEEFPDLLKIKSDYGAAIDFVAFSMDEENQKLIKYLDKHPGFKAVDATQENLDFKDVIAHRLGLITGENPSFGISATSYMIPYTILLKNHKILYKASGTFDPKALRRAIDQNK